MKINMTLSKAISYIIAAGALGVSAQALAQEQEDAAAATAESDDGQVIEEIITTGSRIKRDVFSSSTPIDVVVAEDAASQGISDLSTLLQSTTVAAGSPQINSTISSAFVTNGGTGAETLSLRGLGANRTLMLINGRRAGPAGTRGEVSSLDLNVIPLSMVERVEILKDGASSIYGSDAVAGVVNIITKKGDGAEINGFVSMPSESGGEQSQLSATWGKTFSRGTLNVVVDYKKQSKLAEGDRNYTNCSEQYIFDPVTGERADLVDPRTGEYSCRESPWGQIWYYDYNQFFPGDNPNTPNFRNYLQYDYDGTFAGVIPPVVSDPANPYQLVTPPGWYLVNYDPLSSSVANGRHPFMDAGSLIPEAEKMTLFVDGEFEVSDSITAYGELLMNRRKTSTDSYRQVWQYSYNAVNPLDVFGFSTNPLYEGWEGAAYYMSPLALTDHFSSEIDVKYMRLMGGLRGDIGSTSWSWDVHAQYSKSDGDYSRDIIYADSVYDSAFLTGSCEGTLSSVRGVPCVDVPWWDPAFLAGDVSPEVREFLFGVDTGNTTYTQWDIEAFVTGDLFEMPAGTVAGAFGVNYRADEINDVPGEITLAGNSWGLTSAGITKGDDKTSAIFGEVDMPLLKGMELINSLDLNASFRYTDVDSYGSDTTYKIGLNWQIVPSIMLRANRGTSFRAPALYELYLADQTSFLGQQSVDPCIGWGANLADGSITQRLADNCAADGVPADWSGWPSSATVISGGGLGVLEAETSVSETVGVVWTPEFANLSFAVDYWDITINDEVNQLGASSIVSRCYNSEFFPNDPLCDLFTRYNDPAAGTEGDHRVDDIHDSFINIAEQRARGIDYNLQYGTDLSFGVLTFRAQASRIIENTQATYEETATNYTGTIGNPKWVGNLSAVLDVDEWTFNWNANYIGSASDESWFGDPNTTYFGEPIVRVIDVESVTYHNFSVAYDFVDYGLIARVGVSNAFDTNPPRISTLGGSSSTVGQSVLASQYDYYGRSFFLSLNMKF